MHTHIGICIRFNWQIHWMLAFTYIVSYIGNVTAKILQNLCVFVPPSIYINGSLELPICKNIPLSSLKCHQRKWTSTHALCPSPEYHYLCLDNHSLILPPSSLRRRPSYTLHTCCWCVCSSLIAISLGVLEPPVKSNQKWQVKTKGLLSTNYMWSSCHNRIVSLSYKIRTSLLFHSRELAIWILGSS